MSAVVDVTRERAWDVPQGNVVERLEPPFEGRSHRWTCSCCGASQDVFGVRGVERVAWWHWTYCPARKEVAEGRS